jgi:2-aminoethylphosphonate-pyruvate transaminase
LTQVETFRVGCIGHVDPAGMHAAVKAWPRCCGEMEVLDI